MRLLPFFKALVDATIMVTLGAGCDKDSTAPDDPDNPDALGLAVAVRTDASTFQQTGEFILELIPSSSAGVVLLSEPWAISAAVTTPSGVTPNFLFQRLQPPDTSPFSVALLLDNSRSMLRNDPERLRIAAAQHSWETLLERRPDGQVSLLYFGLGGMQPTPAFTATVLLQTWTADPNELSGKLEPIEAASGSRIYSSLLDVSEWIDTTTSVDRRRAVLLLTDGVLTLETSTASAVLASAQRTRVRINAVGLGPASDRGTQSDPEAVALLQELANGTGGLYAGVAIPERLSSALLSLTVSDSTGVLLAQFTLSPVPPSGTQVTGSVKLMNERLGAAQGIWSFIAP